MKVSDQLLKEPLFILNSIVEKLTCAFLKVVVMIWTHMDLYELCKT